VFLGARVREELVQLPVVVLGELPHVANGFALPSLAAASLALMLLCVAIRMPFPASTPTPASPP
jgi:hypothetical protein